MIAKLLVKNITSDSEEESNEILELIAAINDADDDKGIKTETRKRIKALLTPSTTAEATISIE